MPDRTSLIASRLKNTRIALDYPEQAEFARELGVPKSSYSEFESATRRISQSTAFKLREKFRIPLDWTYYGDPRGLPDSVWDKLKKSA